MSSSTTTAAEQVNMDTLLPTHFRPHHAHTFPSLDPRPSNNQTIPSRTNPDATAPSVKTRYTYVVKNAKVIGLVIAGVTLVVTIVGITVGVVTTIVVK
jgi:hypothetical protein